ncbi:unnamed protein product [Gongylonema pulchrum]|uniref:Uncharacterized protein n=1 Tax=Gongylonema pulchrum TaxID=637853 RepID=A0A183DYL4_9BILA|nr:unnamed protein product [Gongylonema pulchrum]
MKFSGTLAAAHLREDLLGYQVASCARCRYPLLDIENPLDSVESGAGAGAGHSVLSSYDDQANSTSDQREFGPLSENPALIDPTIDPTASFSDQGEFELPPPMSELSSAVADAAASRNISQLLLYNLCLLLDASVVRLIDIESVLIFCSCELVDLRSVSCRSCHMLDLIPDGRYCVDAQRAWHAPQQRCLLNRCLRADADCGLEWQLLEVCLARKGDLMAPRRRARNWESEKGFACNIT